MCIRDRCKLDYVNKQNKPLPRANFSRGAGEIYAFLEGFRGTPDRGALDAVRLVRCAECRFVHTMCREISAAQTDSCVIWPRTVRPDLRCALSV